MPKNVFSADNQQERLQIGYYLAGFVDGEGSFNVSQKDPTVLVLLKDTLSCGIIKTRKCDSLFSYDVTKPKDILERVIPFLDFCLRQSRRIILYLKRFQFFVGRNP